MKTIKCLMTTFLLSLLSVFSLQAQNTEGTDFWLTFGKNYSCEPTHSYLELQIRIVCGSKQTDGIIYFTHLGTFIPFSITPFGVYDCNLDLEYRQAVCNHLMGKTNFSVRITSSEPVSVYAFNHCPAYLSDATNVLPVTALGTEYYHTSYTPNSYNSFPSYLFLDAYAVVATKNNTQLFHNGDLVETLNEGQVYYKTSDTDMTGSLITSNHPVAFFAVHQGTRIPPFIINDSSPGNLFQQLAPVNTLAKTFFIPVSVFDREIVRIVASQDSTTITQKGGTLRTGVPGAQETLTNLQARQFVELDLHLDSAGCYIKANHPVEVCALIRGLWHYSSNIYGANPAQCWIPGMEQKVTRSLIAPFVPVKPHYFTGFYALIVTSTDAKEKTEVSVGGAPPIELQGVDWVDNAAAKMSFYSMPLTNGTASYVFSNPAGLIIYGYAHGGLGQPLSYYYLASSAMRDMQGTFYANDISYQILCNNPICEGVVNFRAEIEGNLHPNSGRLKWYINGEEEQTKRDSLKWSKPFSQNNYEIRMWARFVNNDTISKTGTLIVKSCNQQAAFYMNEVHYQTDTTFCSKTVSFRAEIDGFNPSTDILKWYIGDNEETSAETWSKLFEEGNYIIKLEVHFGNGETKTLSSVLKIKPLWIKIKNVRY